MSSVRPKLAVDANAVITAWDTLSGRVVYRTASGSWSSALADVEILAGAAARRLAMDEACADAMVNSPYAMEVDADGEIAGREMLRETLRANGPGDAARTETMHFRMSR